MHTYKVFQIAFVISMLAHGAILFQYPGLKLWSSGKLAEKIEVSYIKDFPKLEDAVKAPVQVKQQFLKLPRRILSDRRPPQFEEENISRARRGIISPERVFEKPALEKPDIIAVRKKITLPPVDLDKIESPSYISYYQIIREKIRRAAYQNYTHTEVGEVYLSFVIASDGYLKDVRLVPEKSTQHQYLKDVAARSIKDASPFPRFPVDLDYAQLSFNVVISFEVE